MKCFVCFMILLLVSAGTAFDGESEAKVERDLGRRALLQATASAQASVTVEQRLSSSNVSILRPAVLPSTGIIATVNETDTISSNTTEEAEEPVPPVAPLLCERCPPENKCRSNCRCATGECVDFQIASTQGAPVTANVCSGCHPRRRCKVFHWCN